jgi:hypothetical protein
MTTLPSFVFIATGYGDFRPRSVRCRTQPHESERPAEAGRSSAARPEGQSSFVAAALGFGVGAEATAGALGSGAGGGALGAGVLAIVALAGAASLAGATEGVALFGGIDGAAGAAGGLTRAVLATTGVSTFGAAAGREAGSDLGAAGFVALATLAVATFADFSGAGVLTARRSGAFSGAGRASATTAAFSAALPETADVVASGALAATGAAAGATGLSVLSTVRSSTMAPTITVAAIPAMANPKWFMLFSCWQKSDMGQETGPAGCVAAGRIRRLVQPR